MFQWRREAATLPVRGSPPRGPLVRANVLVTEQTTAPTYALVFALELLTPPWTALRVTRVLTKAHIARALERATDDSPPELVGGADDDALAADSAIRQWLDGGPGSQRPPTRADLTRWLLARLEFLPPDALALRGEIEHVPKAVPAADDDDDDDDDDDSALPPPPYSPSPPDFGSDAGDEAPAPSPLDEQDPGESSSPPTRARAASSSSSRRHESRGGAGGAGQGARRPSAAAAPPPPPNATATATLPSSPYRFEPAAARRQGPRPLIVSANAWTEERRHFALEVQRSQRDVEAAKAQQRRAQAIAALRRQQVLEQSQRKLLAHERRRRDTRAVKQSIADALEYHDILDRMDARLKQTRIATTREQEKLTRSMRIVLGGSERWQRGAVIGPGPLSQGELTLRSRAPSQRDGGGGGGSADDDDRPPAPWVYDLHGRRHTLQEAGAVEERHAFAAAMAKLQRFLDRHGVASVARFRAHNVDRSGALDHGEFLRLLAEQGVALSPAQAATLFRHFDPNDSGAIDYGELLWGVFNRRQFLRRWHQRKTCLSPREVRMLFFKYDRTGRGALSPRDFQLALEDMGFRVTDAEVQVLALRFDANQDGAIDYNEFHAFVSGGEDDDARPRPPPSPPSSSSSPSTTTTRTRTRTTPTTRPRVPAEAPATAAADETRDMARIRRALDGIQHTRRQIQQLIHPPHHHH